LGFLLVSALLAMPVAAASNDGKLGSLLAAGYEIKAAYISEGKTKFVLQKGASVFECWAHKNEVCLLIN
jgi:hypothetical protein